jgi:hypothetical protein
MATEKQYLFFKSLHDEETARERQLNELARNYLSLATLYSAFVLFVLDKARPDSSTTKVVFFAAIGCMLIWFLLSLWATKVSDYEAVNAPHRVFAEFGSVPLDDEEFFDNRIADYIVACERNTRANDLKASRLKLAGYSLLVGITLQACYLTARGW